MTESHHHPHTDKHSAAHVHGPSCACGHDHEHAPVPTPKLAAPVSLIASGSPVRLGIAAVAIVALWAVTWWALGA